MRVFSGVVLVAGVSGCGVATTYTPLNPPPRELHVGTREQVPVLDVAPSQPHVEIGRIEARPRANATATKERLYAEVSKLGAQRGCDAVHIVALSGERYMKQLVGACIVFKEPPRDVAVKE